MSEIDMITVLKSKIEFLETHYSKILAEIEEKKSKGESTTVGENAVTNKIYDPSNGCPLQNDPSMKYSEWIAFYKDKLNTLENYMIDQRLKELNGLFNCETVPPFQEVVKETKNSLENHMVVQTDIPIRDEIVKEKVLPKKSIDIVIKNKTGQPRKAIPKKIRGEVWTNHFGSSTKGNCFCCKTDLDIFDCWHAGHIVAHSNGGIDGADNLRPVCVSCNLSMGTENMDSFKERCYPN